MDIYQCQECKWNRSVSLSILYLHRIVAKRFNHINFEYGTADTFLDQDAVIFTDESADGTLMRHRYEKFVAGQPTSHSEETCAYCIHRASRTEQARSQHLAEVEEAFELAGVGRGAIDDDESDADMEEDSDDDDEMNVEEETDIEMDVHEGAVVDTGSHPADEWEMFYEDGPCHGVLDITFTGLTEPHHGDAWCHYMYYGRLRKWDGLIVLVGVPVSLLSVLHPISHSSFIMFRFRRLSRFGVISY